MLFVPRRFRLGTWQPTPRTKPLTAAELAKVRLRLPKREHVIPSYMQIRPPFVGESTLRMRLWVKAPVGALESQKGTLDDRSSPMPPPTRGKLGITRAAQSCDLTPSTRSRKKDVCLLYDRLG